MQLHENKNWSSMGYTENRLIWFDLVITNVETKKHLKQKMQAFSLIICFSTQTICPVAVRFHVSCHGAAPDSSVSPDQHAWPTMQRYDARHQTVDDRSNNQRNLQQPRFWVGQVGEFLHVLYVFFAGKNESWRFDKFSSWFLIHGSLTQLSWWAKD